MPNPTYPNIIDTYPAFGSGILSGYTIEPYHISTLYDIVSGIEQALGLNPKNGFASIAARVSGLESGYFNIVTNTTTNVVEGVNLYFTNARARSAFTANSPIFINANGLISGQFASSIQSGFLSSVDWNTFNLKSNLTLISGNLTTSTPGLSIGGGTNSVIGAGTTINIQVATSSQSGILGSGDFATFNAKQTAIVANAPLALSAAGVLSGKFASSTESGFLQNADWTTFNNKISNASNLGTGTGVYASTSSTTLQFKSLLTGNNINIVSDANTITISALGTAGVTNSFNAPLVLNGTIVSGKFASATESGFLSNIDWKTFNSGFQTSGGTINGNVVIGGSLVVSGNQTIAANNILKVNTISDNGQTLTVNPTGNLVVTNNYYSMNSNTGFDINGNGGTPGNITSAGTLNLSSTQLMQLNSRNSLTLFATGIIQLTSNSGISTQGTIAPLSSGVDGIGTPSLSFKNIYADNIFVRSTAVALSGNTGTTNSFNAPLILNGTIVSGKFASSIESGFLQTSDWNAFNSGYVGMSGFIKKAGDTFTGTLSGPTLSGNTINIGLQLNLGSGVNVLNSLSGVNNLGASSNPFSGVFATNFNSQLVIKESQLEVPAGAINNSNTTFTLVNSPYQNTLKLFTNGLLMMPSGIGGSSFDYTLSSGNIITYVVAPFSGVNILSYYNYL